MKRNATTRSETKGIRAMEKLIAAMAAVKNVTNVEKFFFDNGTPFFNVTTIDRWGYITLTDWHIDDKGEVTIGGIIPS